ncbi:hypothetical protein [Acidovorax sp.]|uniref:hypothetical protein n=1 Tax=Acidovorax sp. TaxID=1872122 RepID=UPI0025C70423|nr:hypothetical protein [Acidovorax sp.]
MELNVFAGARRIALAVSGLWALGCLAYAVFSEPYVLPTFAVQTYGASPVPADNCESRDATKYLTVQAASSERVSIALCFIADRADNGSYLIPYREVVSAANPEAARVYTARKEALRQGAATDAARLTEYLLAMPIDSSEPRTVWMGSENDTEVRTYIDNLAASFRLSPSDIEWLQELKRQKLWEQWKQALQILFGGLAVGWAVTAGVGWIVRGFLGIPRGKDHRPV